MRSILWKVINTAGVDDKFRLHRHSPGTQPIQWRYSRVLRNVKELANAKQRQSRILGALIGILRGKVEPVRDRTLIESRPLAPQVEGGPRRLEIKC